MSFIRSYDEILTQIDAIDPVAFAKTRNHLTGAVSRLSPYITRGLITLPEVRDRVLRHSSAVAANKFIQELAWREYFQNVWWARSDDIFTDLRFGRSDWRHQQWVAAITEATTGIKVIDAAIQELYTTGYMHNHARMWVAALACNLAKAHWLPMSRWLYYYLLDGDLASNTLSWQWVAGTSVNKRYDCNQALINGCSTTQQTNSFLNIDRSDLHTIPIPEQLQVSVPVQLSLELPAGDTVTSVSGQRVALYHPWHLAPNWRADEVWDRRLLVIEPSHFVRFPVSEQVLQFIIRQAYTLLPELELYVGEVSDIPDLAAATAVHTCAYPAIVHWPIPQDEPPRLFPAVTGYYPSFFKYWQAVQRSGLW